MMFGSVGLLLVLAVLGLVLAALTLVLAMLAG